MALTSAQNWQIAGASSFSYPTGHSSVAVFPVLRARLRLFLTALRPATIERLLEKYISRSEVQPVAHSILPHTLPSIFELGPCPC